MYNWNMFPSLEGRWLTAVSHPISILVIESDRYLRGCLVDLLTMAGYRVLEADTAQRGLRLALSHLPDLITTTYRLPDLDGCEVCRRLHADPRTASIPIIAISATPEKRHALLAAGASLFLPKPVDPDELLDILAGWNTRAFV